MTLEEFEDESELFSKAEAIYKICGMDGNIVQLSSVLNGLSILFCAYGARVQQTMMFLEKESPESLEMFRRLMQGQVNKIQESIDVYDLKKTDETIH